MNEWGHRAISDITELVSRGEAPRYVGFSSVSAIGQRCIRPGRFDSSAARPHDERAIDGVLWARAGDVLLNSTGTGTIGRSCVYPGGGRYIVDGHVTVIRARPGKADGRFIAAVLQSPAGQSCLERRCYSGSTNQVVDEHITVLDLAQKIPPVRITDLDFAAKVAGLASPRAKASEMEHAARHHIRTHFDEDPARYQSLSERLDEILERLDEHWDQLVLELEGFVSTLAAPPEDDGTGLDPVTEGPFHGVLAQSLPDADPLQADELIRLAREIVAHARTEITTVGFWSNAFRQDELRKWIKLYLDHADLWSVATCDALAAQLVELTRANRARLMA